MFAALAEAAIVMNVAECSFNGYLGNSLRTFSLALTEELRAIRIAYFVTW